MAPSARALVALIAAAMPLCALPSMTPSYLREVQMPYSSGNPLTPNAPVTFEPVTTMHAVRKLLPGHTDSVNCLSAAEQASLLLSGSDDGTARAWDLRTLQCVIGFQARAAEGQASMPVNSVLYSPTREHAVLLAAGPCVMEYDLRMPAHPHDTMHMHYTLSQKTDRLCRDDITQIALNHAGTKLAVADEGGGVMIWDLGSRKTKALTPHGGLTSCLAWRTYMDPLCNHLLTGGADMKLRMHDMLTGKVVSEWDVKSTEPPAQQHINPPFVHALDVSVDGGRMIVGAGDGALRVYNLDEEEEEEEEREREPRIFLRNRHKTSITCASFPLKTPANTCVTGGDDAHIKFWDIDEEGDNVMGSDVLLDVPHGLKPNWVLCRSFGTSLAAPHFFVADVSSTISAYTFKL